MPPNIKFPIPNLIGKSLFLNGMVYIFFHPNDDSIIAMRVEKHEMKKQRYKSQHFSNVTILKNVIPYYS